MTCQNGANFKIHWNHIQCKSPDDDGIIISKHETNCTVWNSLQGKIPIQSQNYPITTVYELLGRDSLIDYKLFSPQ